MSRSRGEPGIHRDAAPREILQVVLAIFISLSCSQFVIADDDEFMTKQMIAVVEQLENPSFEKREEATRRLAELIDFDINLLTSFLKDPDLTAEQRNRLLRVFNDKLINRPRGALGISMNTRSNPRNYAVEIIGLVRGMPAEKVLRVGDRIRRIDSIVVRRGEDLSWVVQSRMPGDKVLITLDRPKSDQNGLRIFNEKNEVIYELVQIELELGSVAFLTESSSGNVGNRVREDRIKQAQVATARFAPTPKLITILNRDDMHRAMLGSDPVDPEVDKHPIIRLMLQDLERIVKGQEPITAADEERWNKYQKQLALQVVHPDNTKKRRDFLRMVFERFLELNPR